VSNHKTTYRAKVARAETKALGGNRIEAVVSTEARDRDGDIIRAAGWDLGDFLQHPVLVSSHNYGSLRAQIGHWESMEVRGKKLIGVAEYYAGEGNQEADWGYNLASKGRAAYSVGFLPDMSKAKEMEGEGPFFVSYEFNGQKLWEVSQVIIPSNPDALQIVRTTKGLHPVVSELIDEALAELRKPGEQNQPRYLSLDDFERMLPDQLQAALKDILPPLLKELNPSPPEPEPSALISPDEFRELLRGVSTW